MVDYVDISKSNLSKKLINLNPWTTKSLTCDLSRYKIDEDFLYKRNLDKLSYFLPSTVLYDLVDFSGKIIVETETYEPVCVSEKCINYCNCFTVIVTNHKMTLIVEHGKIIELNE